MPQLIFAGLASLVLYGMFVFIQTVRHRDYFLPPGGGSPDQHAPPPSDRSAWLSFGLLVACLMSVVGIAKLLAPVIESAVAAVHAPHAVVGIVIALLVLLPETWAALRAARSDRLQTSFNLAYGSALASIGLTIPVVVCASILLGLPLVLGVHGRRDGNAGPDVPGQHDHPVDRAHPRLTGCRSSGYFCGVPVPVVFSLSGRAGGAPVRERRRFFRTTPV